MLKFEKHIEIDAPLEEVFAYTADPAHLRDYWVGVDEVKDIQHLPNGGYAFTTIDKILGLRFDAKGEHVEFVPNEHIMTRLHGAFLGATLVLQFERLESRKTLVRIRSEWEFPGGPLAKLGEPFLSRYLDHGGEMTMEALKAHIEAGALTIATH